MNENKFFKINGGILDAIAKKLQKMVGTNKKMTPEEIIQWLDKVIFFSQGWAFSDFTTPEFIVGATARLPVVVKGTASSIMTVPSFTAGAVGEIIE